MTPPDEAPRPWLPMEIAPRDRRIDLRAERWVTGHDRMRTKTFRVCRWSPGGTGHSPAPYWRRLPPGWTPTGWRETEQEPKA